MKPPLFSWLLRKGIVFPHGLWVPCSRPQTCSLLLTISQGFPAWLASLCIRISDLYPRGEPAVPLPSPQTPVLSTPLLLVPLLFPRLRNLEVLIASCRHSRSLSVPSGCARSLLPYTSSLSPCKVQMYDLQQEYFYWLSPNSRPLLPLSIIPVTGVGWPGSMLGALQLPHPSFTRHIHWTWAASQALCLPQNFMGLVWVWVALWHPPLPPRAFLPQPRPVLYSR